MMLAPHSMMMTLQMFFWLVDMVVCPRWAVQADALGYHEIAMYCRAHYECAQLQFTMECA